LHLKVVAKDADDECHRGKKIMLAGLGLNVKENENLKVTSNEKPGSRNLLKFRSSAKYDPETKMRYHVALALRKNGSVEFYSDFNYVDVFHKQNDCVDIEAAGSKFVIRCVDQEHKKEIDPKEGMKFNKKYCTLYRSKVVWKNRLSSSTMRPMRKDLHDDEWDQLLH